jgi:hypothetical protein
VLPFKKKSDEKEEADYDEVNLVKVWDTLLDICWRF